MRRTTSQTACPILSAENRDVQASAGQGQHKQEMPSRPGLPPRACRKLRLFAHGRGPSGKDFAAWVQKLGSSALDVRPSNSCVNSARRRSMILSERLSARKVNTRACFNALSSAARRSCRRVRSAVRFASSLGWSSAGASPNCFSRVSTSASRPSRETMISLSSPRTGSMLPRCSISCASLRPSCRSASSIRSTASFSGAIASVVRDRIRLSGEPSSGLFVAGAGDCFPGAGLSAAGWDAAAGGFVCANDTCATGKETTKIRATNKRRKRV